MSEAQLRSMKKELFIIKEAKPAISVAKKFILFIKYKFFYLDIQLPTGLDILQHLIYNQQCRSVSISSIIACPPKKNFSRCSESCCECILSKIKRPWIKAGFDVLTDLSLVKKLFKLHKSYSNLKKNAKRRNSGDLAKKNEFEIEIKKLFWAGNSNLILILISKDKKRSLKDKIEDLKFLEDQENERKFVIGSEDIKYRKKAKESIRKKNRLQPKILRDGIPNVELIDTILSDDSSIDSDFEPGDWYHIEVSENPDTVIAKIPKDVFAGNVSLTATACDISPNVLQKVTNAILYQLGVDLKEVKSSQSTAYRKMKKENENMAKISKEDVKAALDASPHPCIIHFDGKTLFELNKGKMLKRDRMAVLVNINGQTYLLGVPPLASSTGEDQFLGVMNLIKEYQLTSKTRGICFDTTSSNTGTNKGSVSRISQELGKYLLQIACRHHVTELRILHFWKLVTNEEISGPDNPLFKKLKNTFEEPNFNYNSVLLLWFDWNKVKSSFLEKAAMESLTFCKAYVSKPGIIRDDRSKISCHILIPYNI
ncbi:uncharacterized protein LOC136082191 [Hydra vulgaris]|uniref:Uncharacterized protein LOC136082191 n=1 Tax=Hydra vulgaris TaxID=6087 RepID=A0ABM4C5D3_HYDVU